MDALTKLDVLLFLLFGCIALAFLVPFIYALVKKKWWLLIAEGIVVVCIVLCCYLFPTQFPYMDQWIIGKTRVPEKHLLLLH